MLVNQPIRHRPSAMGIDIEYLRSYLEDEFKDVPDLRIYVVLPSSTRKSPDLPQDYDPNEGHVHLNRGVNVRARSRIYFFPAQWTEPQYSQKIRDQIDEIRTFVGAAL